VTWQEAFDEVVLQRLRDDAASIEIWQQARRGNFDPMNAVAGHGQLAERGSWRNAWWGAFRYQRYHADALLDALEDRYDAKVDRVFFDLGCGAGTVAVAIDEHLRRTGSSIRMSYVGFDHNRHAISLAGKMLATPSYGHVEPVLTTTSLGEAVDGCLVLRREGMRPFVTLSYLLRQDSVDSTAVEAFASAVAEVVADAAPHMVPLVIMDLALPATQNLDLLCDRLSASVAIEGSRVPRTLAVPRRFPNLYPDQEGWFQVRSPRPTIHGWTLKMTAR